MKIVVANSVGVDSQGYHMVHVPSRWSLGIKNFTNCGYYPWQLSYACSLLKRDTKHQVKFLDGVLNAWDYATYLEKIALEKPDWMVMESSTRTIEEDLRLAKAVKERLGTRLIFTGQHPMAEPEQVLQVADYVCIGEYEYSVLELIQGKDPKAIAGVYPNDRRDLLKVDSLPFPEDTDINRIDYHEPNCRYRQIQMYASRGCPRRCNFCAAATLYYDELNWRPRNVDDVVKEIQYLHEKYPQMEGVFFDEEVHNIRKSFNIALAKSICKAGLDHLKYEALCEYVSLDEEAMSEMRKAGYYKIRFGIETGSDLVAEKMTLGKKHNLAKLRSILLFGKQLGFTFYATFSIGGYGSTAEEDKKTVDLIEELTGKGLLDEVQVSINTPQPGTDFHKVCVEKGYLKKGLTWKDFDGNGHVVADFPDYPADEIKKSFKNALQAFDRGKKKANTEHFLNTAKDSFLTIPNGSRVLLMRSVRPWMIQLILQSLGNSQKIAVDLLSQDSVVDEFQSTDTIDRMYTYGDGFITRESVSSELMATLKNNAYDFVLLPMANNHVEGYQNVLDVARHIHPRKLIGVFPEGHLSPLN